MQLGVQDELRTQEHGTEGEASHERGTCARGKGGMGLLKKEHLQTTLAEQRREAGCLPLL